MKFKLDGKSKVLIEFCKENRKIVSRMVLAILILLCIQGIKWSFQGQIYITDDKGKVVAIKREDLDASLSVPLHIKVKNGDLNLEKEVILYLQGRQSGDNKQEVDSLEEETLEKTESALKTIFDELEGSSSEIIKLPNSLEDGTKVQWERAGNSKFAAILLLLPLGILFLYRNQKEKTELVRKRNVQNVKRMLPAFNSQLLLLLNSGLIFNDAFVRIAAGYEMRVNKAYFTDTILEIYKKSRVPGNSLLALLNEVSGEVGVREFSRVVNIISDNQYKGVNLAEKLEEESELLWEQRKKLAEEKGKLAETKLSFPLAILLLVLIMITAAPAVLQI